VKYYFGPICLSFLIAFIFSLICILHIESAIGVLILLLVGGLIIRNPRKLFFIICLLFPFNNIVTVRFFTVDIRMIEIFWIPTFLTLLLRFLMRTDDARKFKFERYDILFLCFLISCGFKAIGDPYSFNISIEIIQIIYLYSIFFFFRNICNDKVYLSYFLKYIVPIAFIFCIFALITAAVGKFPLKSVRIFFPSGGIKLIDSLTEIQYSEISNIHSLIRVDCFFWGSTGTGNILIVLFFLVRASRKLKVYRNKTIILLESLILLCIIFTGSRASWVFMTFLFLLISFIERRYFFLKVFVGFCIVGLCIYLFPSIRERILEIFYTDESSNRSHFASWFAGIEMFVNHPILGVGLGRYPYEAMNSTFLKAFKVFIMPRAAHNILLRILAENGILGIITLGTLLGMVIIKSIKGIIRNHIFREIYFSFLGTFLMNLTMNAFMKEPFWILMGLVMGSYSFSNSKKSKNYL